MYNQLLFMWYTNKYNIPSSVLIPKQPSTEKKTINKVKNKTKMTEENNI